MAFERFVQIAFDEARTVSSRQSTTCREPQHQHGETARAASRVRSEST